MLTQDLEVLTGACRLL